MAAIPLVIGLLIGGATVPAAWLIATSTLLGFLAHYAIVPWASRARESKAGPPGYAARRLGWGASYLTLAIACFAGALAVAPSAARFPLFTIAASAGALAAAYALASILGAGRALAAEVIGMAGMALTAPMMAVAGGATMAPRVFAPSALALSYFLSSVAYVRSYDGLKARDRVAILRCVAAHAAVVAVLAVVRSAGWLPRGWWLPWVPIAVRTVWGIAQPPRNLRALGLRELWVALAFTSLATVLLFQG